MKNKPEVPDLFIQAVEGLVLDAALHNEKNIEILRELLKLKLGEIFKEPLLLVHLATFVAAMIKEEKKAAETAPVEPETIENTGLYGIEDLEKLTDANLKEVVKAGIQVLHNDLIAAIGEKEATLALKGLATQGIATISDLLARSRNELCQIRNFGNTHEIGVVHVLAKNKLRLKR